MMRLTVLAVLFFVAVAMPCSAQTLANFETEPLTPSGASVVNNPDLTGNPSSKAGYYQKVAGNWHAVYLAFATEKNTGNNDRLTFKIRSSTKGRVFVKIVSAAGATMLENWAPDYNTQPAANQWTECALDLSAIKNSAFKSIEVNASVDNETAADVYLDDFKLVNSKALNGEPIIGLAVSAYQITSGESVHFDASASEDDDGAIVSYTWNFGDGSSGSGEQADHVFAQEGIFNVKLTVEDNDGKKSTKKISIGVLPLSGKLGKLIVTTQTPLRYQKTEAIFLVKGTYSNVYDPAVIKIDALITHPDASVTSVPCFYYQEASYTPDQWVRDTNTGYWMLRFTPGQTGLHHVQLTLTDADGTVTSSSYEVGVQDSGAKGFVRMDAADQQYFRHSTGQPFYPLGINAAWDNTTNYTSILQNLGAAGANLVRYWLVPFDRQGLEWKNGSGFYQGLGVYSQEAAAEQDSVMALCEANNVFLQMTLFQHGMFSETVNSNWADNPYKASNGGPLAQAEQFFYNAEAKAQTKKLLRYTVARWGYATHLFAWELFNEVNFTGNFPNQSAQWYPGVKSWHDEMGQYLKSIDAFHHPVTSSSDESNLPDFDKLTGLDNVQYHLYTPQLLEAQNSKDKSIRAMMTRVGLFNGEYGLDVNTADVPFDDQRISIWTGIMNQVPHLMWKWENYTTTPWANLFQYPAAFVSGEDFVSGGSPSNFAMEGAYNTEILGTAGFRAGARFYGVVYDKIHRSNLSGATVSSFPAGNYTITFMDISTGSTTSVTTDVFSKLTLPQFSKGIAFKAKLNGDVILALKDASRAAFTFYPNPSSGEVSIWLSQERPIKIEVVGLGAAKELSWTADSEDKTVVNVSLKGNGLVPGVHIFRVTTTKKVYISKVIYVD